MGHKIADEIAESTIRLTNEPEKRIYDEIHEKLGAEPR